MAVPRVHAIPVRFHAQLAARKSPISGTLWDGRRRAAWRGVPREVAKGGLIVPRAIVNAGHVVRPLRTRWPRSALARLFDGLASTTTTRSAGATAPLRRVTVPTAGSRWARTLSAIVAGLMVGSSVAGLTADAAEEAQRPVVAMLRGYDVVALVNAAPLLAGSLLPALRRSPRAQLMWLSMLAFDVYHYAYYVLGTVRGAAFPAHVALLALSGVALALGLRSLDVAGIAATFAPRSGARPAALVLLALALSLGAMWVGLVAKSARTGDVLAEPSRLVLPAEMTRLGAILDMSLLIPTYLLAGVLLWQRSPWGFVLAPVLLLSGTVHQVGYMAALLSQARASIPGASAWDPAEPIIAAGFGAAAAVLLAACGRRSPHDPCQADR